MHDLLRNTVFCAERVSVIAKKMVNDVARVKRKGNKMALALIRNLVFSDKSNHSNSSLVRQQHFLRKVIEDLGQSPDRVIRTLTELRNTITRPECLTFHMAAQLDSLLEAGDDPLTPWKTHMFADWGQPQEPPVDGLANLEADYQLLKESTEQPTGAALSLGSVESCFLIQAVRSIDNIEHPDFAAVLVELQYLGQLEGPFWRQLRAQGLVYGYNLNLKVIQSLRFWLIILNKNCIVFIFVAQKNRSVKDCSICLSIVLRTPLAHTKRLELFYRATLAILMEYGKTVCWNRQGVRSYLS